MTNNDLEERIILFALVRLFSDHPKIGTELLRLAGSLDRVFSGDRNRFREVFDRHETLWGRFSSFREWGEAKDDATKAQEMGIGIISAIDPHYPVLLKEIFDPPLAILHRGGGLHLLSSPAVAIVGSRRATNQGCNITADIATVLSSHGISVISGMAYGIDSAAHRGALSAGGTVAVIGCGPDVIYPPGNRALDQEIEREGVILSEFPIGREPFAHQFPQRNRIISGLSVATVVVEAAKRSGSLITARFALEQGREVMASPGAAAAPHAAGNNHLIRQGALLVESGEDVIAALSAGSIGKSAGHSGRVAVTDSEIFDAAAGRPDSQGDEDGKIACDR